MPGMQNVETTVCENELLPKLPKPGSDLDDFFKGLDLLKRHNDVRE
jgi:hypothetical protein